MEKISLYSEKLEEFMENQWTLIDVLILKIIFLNEREYQLFFRNYEIE